MAELKPCPFCGTEAKWVLTAIFKGERYGYVRCGKAADECCVSTAEMREDRAIEIWNKRVPQTTVNQFGENCTHISNCGTLNLNL